MAPKQKPGKSNQNVGTPPDFIRAVERRFGAISCDVAASEQLHVCRHYYTSESNGLVQRWDAVGWHWCNPPYARPRPWVDKAIAEMDAGAKTMMLVPASTGTAWFRQAALYGHIIELWPRIKFVGHSKPYPKDLVLIVFMAGITGRSEWNWKESACRTCV